MDAYLALGYIPAPLAIFRSCRKLEPGHVLRFKNGEVEIRRWWRPELVTASKERNRAERIERLRTIVADAVHLRLRADVPVAIFLSGGVDSSVIAAECARQGSKLEAFTADFQARPSRSPERRPRRRTSRTSSRSSEDRRDPSGCGIPRDVVGIMTSLLPTAPRFHPSLWRAPLKAVTKWF